jgi:uncharacterized phage protein gp47/JayE
MAFVPRTYEQILTDMVAHVKANSTLTDFNIGSAIRTILEAAALEDDEQYYQMVQLLDAFSFSTATAQELDERAADFNLERLDAAQATGVVRFQNGAAVRSTLAFDASTGATSINLDDSTEFPISGFPYDVRVGEGTADVEDVAVSANNPVIGVLTVAALANDHSAGARVTVVSGSTQTIPSGTQVQVPAKGIDLPIVFQTVEAGIVTAGNLDSNLVSVVAAQAGTFSNIGASQVNQFTGGVPFTGATVSNPSSTGGGRDQETDIEFRDRIKLRIQALGRGTPQAIEGGIIGTEESTTGQRVTTAKLQENFTTEEHLLYIDDGTGFTPDTVIMSTSTVNGNQASPVSTLLINDASNFPASGTVLLSPGTVRDEVLEYDSITTNTLNLSSSTTKTHNDTDGVVLVDDVGTAEEGQNFFNINNFPARRNTIEIYDNDSGQYNLRTEGTDYFFNRTNGDIQYSGAGLIAGARVFANYTYYTGLVSLAQKIVNGDPEDSINFPGLAAAGTIIYVDTPTIRTVSVIAAVSVRNGEDETEIRDDVQLAIENYIDSRTIGQNVILAQIIDRVMDVDGVENVLIQSPTADLTILETELPKSFDSSGNSLVTVL